MPLGLSGGYAAGGMNDTLFQLAKQRLLEQEMAQRAQQQELERIRAEKLDARQVEQENYNRSRDTKGDIRQQELDKEAATARTQQQQVVKYGLLKGQSQADINEALGEDVSTAHVIPTATPANIPGGGPSYRLPAVPIQSNRMMIGDVKMRPPSAEILNEQAADDEKRKTDNAIRQGVAIAQAKPANRSDLSGYVGPKGFTVQRDDIGNLWEGTQQISPDQVRRAPPQPSQADPLAHELLQQRLADAKKAAEPYNIDSDIHYTMNGKAYVDGGAFTGDLKDKARTDAHAKGIPFVSGQVAESMRASDTARSNLDNILVQVKANLPQGAMDRMMKYPGTTFATFFQTDAQKAAFLSWRIAAIQSVQALAEKGMGFRLNKEEIALAVNNDIPQLTDTWQTAERRVGNINTLLDSKENAALEQDRRNMMVPGGYNDTKQKAAAAAGGGTTPQQTGPAAALPPLSARVPGQTEATINGKPMVWEVGGWRPK